MTPDGKRAYAEAKKKILRERILLHAVCAAVFGEDPKTNARPTGGCGPGVRTDDPVNCQGDRTAATASPARGAAAGKRLSRSER